jgi:hypothetical protein
VDDGDADVIERLWHYSAPPAAGQARERVWRRLPQHTLANGKAGARTLTAIATPELTAAREGRAADYPSPVRSRPRWLVAQLATAAVILLTLAGSLFALGPLRPDRQAKQPAVLPAILAPAVDAETILDITMDIPFAGRAFIGVEAWTLRPSPTAVSMPPLGGPSIIAVEHGTLAATVKGVEQQLAQGEHLVLSGSERARFSAEGSQDAKAFAVYIAPSATRVERTLAPDDNESWAYDPVIFASDRNIWTTTDVLTRGSSRIVLERFTLPPGSALPPQQASPLVWTEVSDGVLGMTLQGERLPFRWKPGQEQTYRDGQNLPPIAPGTTMIFRNAGDTPLVLYRLTISPLLMEEAAP